MNSISELIEKINEQIINPLIVLLFAFALAYFIYGITEFLMKIENEEERTKGKQHMLWAVIGMFIMVSVWGILEAVLGTFGVSAPSH